MKSFFYFRSIYWEYIKECMDAGEVPWSFRDWFEVSYYYDMADQLPTGNTYDGTFKSYSINLN